MYKQNMKSENQNNGERREMKIIVEQLKGGLMRR